MIDVHAHVFNAAYVPIAGVLTTRVGMSEDLAYAIAKVFNGIVQMDPFDEEAVAAASTDPLDMSAAELEIDVNTPIENDELAAIEWIVAHTPEDAIRALSESIRDANALLPPETDSMVLFSLHARAFSPAQMDIGRFFVRLVRAMKGWGRWMILLLARESVIVHKMFRLYPMADHFVVHMMDMDNFYIGDSKLEYTNEQIPRLGALSSRMNGRLIPFVAFDPTRRNALDIISNAVDGYGFRGVKFYPPSGYRPINNTSADVPTGVDARIVEANVRALYDLCLERDLPLFTHCQPRGMDARPESGLLSHPSGWIDVLREYPALRLCIGHAGGEQAWFDQRLTSAEEEWRLLTIELCCTHENVYCEVGHLDDVLDRKARKRFRDRLQAANTTSGDHSFADKILYGSDYHLILRTHNFHKVPALLREVVVAAGIDGDKFFDGNARQYLAPVLQ